MWLRRIVFFAGNYLANENGKNYTVREHKIERDDISGK